nr:hypothetical protein [Tanacetum cinerariifolium]
MATKVFAYLFLLLSVGVLREVHGEPEKTWCVAKPSSSQAELLGNLNYACSYVDCKILEKDGACYLPDNLMNHASIAMNIFYQHNGRHQWECYFGNSGLITLTDPSYGGCQKQCNQLSFTKLTRPKLDTYYREIGLLKDGPGPESSGPALRKHHLDDFLADPKRQPRLSCRQGKTMVDSVPEREGVKGVEEECMGTSSRERPFAPALLTQSTHFSAFIKENIDVLRTLIKEHDKQAQPRRTQRNSPTMTLKKKAQEALKGRACQNDPPLERRELGAKLVPLRKAKGAYLEARRHHLKEGKTMVDSVSEREGVQGVEEVGMGTSSRERPFSPALLTQSTHFSAFIKENIDVLRTLIKEHDKQAQTKATPKKLTHDDFEEKGSGSSERRGLSERSSSGTTRTRSKARSSKKSQRSLSRSKTSSPVRRSKRFGNRSRSKKPKKEEPSPG